MPTPLESERYERDTQRKAALEAMIDSVGLSVVLHDLGEIALEKATHIRANWQDDRLAKDWDKTAGKLFYAVNTLPMGVA